MREDEENALAIFHAYFVPFERHAVQKFNILIETSSSIPITCEWHWTHSFSLLDVSRHWRLKGFFKKLIKRFDKTLYSRENYFNVCFYVNLIIRKIFTRRGGKRKSVLESMNKLDLNM